MMLLASATVGPISAASNTSPTFPVARAKQLGAEWWRWAFSFPTETNPLADATGARCAEGDQGKVFFLAGIAGPIAALGKVERTCPDAISKDQAILVPIANATCLLNVQKPIPCFFPNQPVTDFKTLQKQVKQSVDAVKKKTLELDGEAIDVANARVQSHSFKVNVADGNPFDAADFGFPVPGGDYIANADGYWALLKPLTVGKHDLHIQAVIGVEGADDFVVDVTYHITIK